MIKLVLTVTLIAMLASLAEAQQTPDPRVADLVQAGKIRVGVHCVMYGNDAQSGELKAGGNQFFSIWLVHSARIGAEVVPVGHPTVPEMLTCLTTGACDTGFMGPAPSRTGVDFSPPILQLDYTFLVPAASSTGIRIAAASDHASTLTLGRILKHAQLVYARARFLNRFDARRIDNLSACLGTAIWSSLAFAKLIVRVPPIVSARAIKAFELATPSFHRRLSANGGLDLGIL